MSFTGKIRPQMLSRIAEIACQINEAQSAGEPIVHCTSSALHQLAQLWYSSALLNHSLTCGSGSCKLQPEILCSLLTLRQAEAWGQSSLL